MPLSKLFAIYLPLIGWTGLGWLLGRWLPKSAPAYVGRFLFWLGVPIGIVAFLRHTCLSATLWLAPVSAWAAILLGLGAAYLWLRWRRSQWARTTQTSFLLTSMIGNTGYIGFPVSLTLVGPQYFAWALFYDLLGSMMGAYGLGVTLAARAGSSADNLWQPFRSLLINPTLWSFGFGLLSRDVPLPPVAEAVLQHLAWGIVSLSLILIGMRLSQVSSWQNLQPVSISLSIKMLLVPLILGTGLWLLGITGAVHQALVLQMAMPPAFATLVISEAYDLDRELAVTAIATGSLTLLLTLPLWLWLFPS
ncbi:AEC family transporter [Leptodesmis sp.]|uniref:AEC family transporter n=1 Tax=Leptodesmis sp. TaxID=3100501 RepID=UPI00405345C6